MSLPTENDFKKVQEGLQQKLKLVKTVITEDEMSLLKSVYENSTKKTTGGFQFELCIQTNDGWVVSLLTDKPVDLGDAVISSIIVQPKEDYAKRVANTPDVLRSKYQLGVKRKLTDEERKQLEKESMYRYVDILQAYLAEPGKVEELAVNAMRIDLEKMFAAIFDGFPGREKKSQ